MTDAERSGCPCQVTCCDNPDVTTLRDHLESRGEWAGDDDDDQNWMKICRSCGDICNCEV